MVTIITIILAIQLVIVLGLGIFYIGKMLYKIYTTELIHLLAAVILGAIVVLIGTVIWQHIEDIILRLDYIERCTVLGFYMCK